jgi:hypothetical protein
MARQPHFGTQQLADSNRVARVTETGTRVTAGAKTIIIADGVTSIIIPAPSEVAFEILAFRNGLGSTTLLNRVGGTTYATAAASAVTLLYSDGLAYRVIA